jgi:4-hydroxy-3-methylbut-2-enyl diphosphate reductase IspH
VEGAVETAGDISRDALEAVKSGLKTAASAPREVVEAAVKGAEEKQQGKSS